MSDAFTEWKQTGLNDERMAVVLVAEGLTNAANRGIRWWQRKRHPMDAIPLAREAVAVLLLLPEGRELSRRILTIESSVPDLPAHNNQDADV